MRDKLSYSAELMLKLTEIIELMQREYKFILYNIDIANDYNCAFKIELNNTFRMEASQAMPDEYRRASITYDMHSVTIEEQGKRRFKFYDKVAETLLISSVRAKVGGIHRFASYASSAFIEA